MWVTEQEEASGMAVTAAEAGGAAEAYLSVILPELPLAHATVGRHGCESSNVPIR